MSTRTYTATEAMLLIKSIDPRARLELSEWTGKWYVHASVDRSDGVTLTGLAEHCDSPGDAVHACLTRLQAVDMHDFDHVLVTSRATADGRERQHWRWNGAAFASEPVEAFVARRGAPA